MTSRIKLTHKELTTIIQVLGSLSTQEIADTDIRDYIAYADNAILLCELHERMVVSFKRMFKLSYKHRRKLSKSETTLYLSPVHLQALCSMLEVYLESARYAAYIDPNQKKTRSSAMTILTFILFD